jgi:hypothetical protein
MNFRIPFAAALMAALLSSLAAQTPCPMQTTQHVPENVHTGPLQDCNGVQYPVIEVPTRLVKGTCPTFIVYTPPHEIAVPSPNQTYVDVVQTLPITMVTFECNTRWLLFLPIGTNCTPSQTSNVGYVLSLVARPCVAPQG